MNLVGLGVVRVVEPDQERLKQLHGEDYSQVAVAAMVGKTEATWTGHHRNDSSSDLHRNRRMSEVEGNLCLCTEEVGGNYQGRLWEDVEGE